MLNVRRIFIELAYQLGAWLPPGAPPLSSWFAATALRWLVFCWHEHCLYPPDFTLPLQHVPKPKKRWRELQLLWWTLCDGWLLRFRWDWYKNDCMYVEPIVCNHLAGRKEEGGAGWEFLRVNCRVGVNNCIVLYILYIPVMNRQKNQSRRSDDTLWRSIALYTLYTLLLCLWCYISMWFFRAIFTFIKHELEINVYF